MASPNNCFCDSGCDPELFENTLHLRELRLDLEELLAEKKKGAEALKKMCDTVTKKVFFSPSVTLSQLPCSSQAGGSHSDSFFSGVGASAGESGEAQSEGSRREFRLTQQREATENE